MIKAVNSMRTRMDGLTRAELQKLGQDAMREINDRIQAVLDRAPSDASAFLLIRLGHRGYKGVLKVASRQRKFIGGGAAADFGDVVDRVFSEVNEQIEQWKKQRFLDQA